MPKFQITTPDGAQYQVEAPDLATAQKAIEGIGGATSGPTTAQTTSRGGSPASQEQAPYTWPRNDPATTITSMTSGLEAFPIAGPSLFSGAKTLRGMAQGMTPEQVDAEVAAARAKDPEAYNVGSTIMGVGPLVGAGMAFPRLFGMGEAVPFSAGPRAVATDIALRGAASGASMGGIGTADSLARGKDLETSIKENLLPAGIAAAIPAAGALARGGLLAGKSVANWTLGGLPRTIGQWANTEKAGQNLVGRAMGADEARGLTMSPADEAVARAGGLNLVNLDFGGPATRNLARSAKSTSPEGTAALNQAVERGAPGLDTSRFLTTLVGGSADDIALREGLRSTARVTNGSAYKAAEMSPSAANIWTPEIQQLMGSPRFLAAVKAAEEESRDYAARTGGQVVQSPFVFGADGRVTMKPGVTPSLKFWDQVQRNLRSQAEAAPRGGQVEMAFNDLRSQLLNVLDTRVPEFQIARRGAAQFFGAEDMIDAGRQFALQPRNLPEAMKVLQGASEAERKAFAIGAASSAVDVLKTSNTFGHITQLFDTPAQKEFWQATLGKAKADQLEAFIKVQKIQNASKTAVQGGSQTYDLLLAGGLGLGGAAGSQFAPGNPFSTAAFYMSAARLGRVALGKYVDNKVLTEVAKLLASNDKAALNKVIANASMSPKWMAAVSTITAGLARGEVALAAGPRSDRLPPNMPQDQPPLEGDMSKWFATQDQARAQ